MTIKFTAAAYRALLELTHRAGFHLLCMRDAATAPSPVCLLRHDIDFCLEYAVAMAEVEHEFGITATYFVLPDNNFYDPFSPQGGAFVQRIAERGHEIGLHYDSTRYPSDKTGYSVAFRRDLLRLGALVSAPIVSAAQHIPINSPFIDISSLINNDAYGASIRSRFDYISDSSMAWRDRTPFDLIAAGKDFQFLTHPIWWFAPQGTREGKLRSLTDVYGPHMRDACEREVEKVTIALAKRKEGDERFRQQRVLS